MPGDSFDQYCAFRLLTGGGPKDHRWPTLQQPPGSAPPPEWLAHPEDYQPPKAASPYQAAPPSTGYTELESFVQQQEPLASSQQATGDGTFSITSRNWKITGWRAAGLIALALAAFTLFELWQYANTTANLNAYDQAPLCAGAKVEPGCKTHALMRLNVDSSTSHCYLSAHQDRLPYPYYRGEFSSDVCGKLSNGSQGLVEIWQRRLVRVIGLRGYDLASDSPVVLQESALKWMLITALVDAGYALIVVLYFISWVTGRRRSTKTA